MSKVKNKLKITGMHCTSCAMNIDFDLEDLDGVEKANTSYARQETIIEYDQNVIDQETIIKQIKSTGYNAVFVKE